VRNLKFAIFGGDARFVMLREVLTASGHSVRCHGLGDGSLTPAEAAKGADCVILPLPCESGGRLNAPLCPEPAAVPELTAYVRRGTPICGGKIGSALAEELQRQGHSFFDYFAREDFTLKNAELTAEAALTLLLASPGALRGSRVLILGFGRIGRFLAAKLLALGAQVTAAARRPEDRALAEIMGCRAVSIDAIAGDYDFAVNTIPRTLFGESELESIPGAALIELASPPYGFDRAAAAGLGREIVLGSGLPGKISPRAAAGAIKDTIFSILEEIK